VNEVRDILGASGALKWDALEIFRLLLLGIIRRPLDHAWGDRVDGHFGGELAC
jgi:hypothetical protein